MRTQIVEDRSPTLANRPAAGAAQQQYLPYDDDEATLVALGRTFERQAVRWAELLSTRRDRRLTDRSFEVLSVLALLINEHRPQTAAGMSAVLTPAVFYNWQDQHVPERLRLEIPASVQALRPLAPLGALLCAPFADALAVQAPFDASV